MAKFPLPCGGARGWVKSHYLLDSALSQNLAHFIKIKARKNEYF